MTVLRASPGGASLGPRLPHKSKKMNRRKDNSKGKENPGLRSLLPPPLPSNNLQNLKQQPIMIRIVQRNLDRNERRTFAVVIRAAAKELEAVTAARAKESRELPPRVPASSRDPKPRRNNDFEKTLESAFSRSELYFS